MSQARRFRGDYGTTSVSPSPVRPGLGGGGAPVAPVRVVNGFTTILPGRTRTFFQRQFFAKYPRPIQAGGPPGFPRRVEIARIQAPKRQSIVIRTVDFHAYRTTGIGTDDLREVSRGRSIGTLGFEFSKGNRGLTDFMTNLPGRGVPVLLSPGQGGQAAAPIAGQGNTQQGVGRSTPDNPGESFAAYAMPGDLLKATAVVFKPPEFDLRLFEVTISGWLAGEKELETIIDSLSR